MGGTTYPTNQATVEGAQSQYHTITALARVGGLLGETTYIAESGQRPSGAAGEACSPEVGEPF